MFDTDHSAKVDIPDGLKEFDESSWWYIRYRLHVHWYHLTCEFSLDDNEKSVHMLFISRLDHLLQVVNESSINIISIDLVTPDHMNEQGGWKMDPLSEVWEAIEPETSHFQQAHIFVLADGSRYVDSALQTNEEHLLSKTKVFQL